MERKGEKTEGMPDEESFAQLLDESFVATERLAPGQRVTATVVKITADWVFLDLGRKGEGCLDRKELAGPDGRVALKEGDTVQAYFAGMEGSELRFTTRIGGGAAGPSQLEDAWRGGIPVEGTVEREVKGGYEVRIAAGVRAFCPFSQMGLPRSGEQGDPVGKRLSFRITEYRERGRSVVVSRRAILEEKRREEIEARKAGLREGMTVAGRVTAVRDFGAFVDIGGIEGLIPASEIAWARVDDVRGAFAVGQEVEAVVIGADWVRERLTLSVRKTLPDPWRDVAERFPPRSRHAGTVARLAPYGAFVSLAPGIDGLLHVSRLGGGKRIRHAGEAVRVGQVVDVTVEAVDPDRKRIALVLAGAEDEDDGSDGGGDYGRYARVEPRSTGSLGDVLKARLDEKKSRS
ncbi:MAG: S1 RNA-binding domain-containing protein [Gemmatimonadota bacterium]